MDPVPFMVDQFLRAVHRRHVALHVLERAGLGTLGGCGAAIFLVALMLWRGQDAWAVAGMALAVGAGAGALWGIVTRPSIHAAAGEVDRQLNLADLLGTAWAVGGGAAPADDPFRRAVLAVAVARCERLSPSAVVLHRLGARSWGGIGLAVAFVATLAAMSSEPLRAGTARERRANSDTRSTAAARDAGRRPIVDVSSEMRPHRQARHERSPEDERRLGKIGAPIARDVPSEPDDATSLNNGDKPSAGDGSAAGDGAAKGADPPPAPSPQPIDVPSADPHTDQPARAAAGAGRTATDALPDDSRAGGRLTQTPPDQAVPWQSPNWPSAVESAAADVRSGRIRDDYRDLVRGYFDPSQSRP